MIEISPGRNRLNFYFDIQFTAKPPFNYIYQGFQGQVTSIILYFRDKRTLFINALGQLCLRHFFLLTGIADLNAYAQCFELSVLFVSSVCKFFTVNFILRVHYST